MRRLVLIDSHSLIHRAYHALPKTFTTRDGSSINAVYGFTRMILKVVKDLKPDYMVAVFDAPGPTFRSEMAPEYKAHRPPTDRDLVQQFDKVDEVTDALSVLRLRVGGYEADDLIATVVENLKRDKDLEVIIVTGDNDLMQLVSSNVKIYYPIKGISQSKLFGTDEVVEKFSLQPSQIADYKALRGDPSDNIPGVSGIGEKTAKDLLTKYKTFEEVYGHLDKIGGRVGDLLRSNRDQAVLSKKLAELEREVPLKFDLAQAQLEIDPEKALPMLEKYEFKSLIKEFQSSKDEGDSNQLSLI